MRMSIPCLILWIVFLFHQCNPAHGHGEHLEGKGSFTVQRQIRCPNNTMIFDTQEMGCIYFTKEGDLTHIQLHINRVPDCTCPNEEEEE